MARTQLRDMFWTQLAQSCYAVKWIRKDKPPLYDLHFTRHDQATMAKTLLLTKISDLEIKEDARAGFAYDNSRINVLEIHDANEAQCQALERMLTVVPERSNMPSLYDIINPAWQDSHMLPCEGGFALGIPEVTYQALDSDQQGIFTYDKEKKLYVSARMPALDSYIPEFDRLKERINGWAAQQRAIPAKGRG